MKNYQKASGDLVKFLHQLEPASKKLTAHSKIIKFLDAGVLTPDLNAAIAYVEMTYAVGMVKDSIDPDGLLQMTPREYCITCLKEKKLAPSSLRQSMTLVAAIYREYIQAGPSSGAN